MGARALVEHERGCKRAQVRPGDRFQMIVATTVGGRSKGKSVRRPIEVEIVNTDGNKGWVVKSLVSGRLMRASTARKFVNWDDYKPGLESKKKGSSKK